MNHPSKSLAEVIAAVERIHAPDLIAHEHPQCIECNVDHPCDAAAELAGWKELAQ